MLASFSHPVRPMPIYMRGRPNLNGPWMGKLHRSLLCSTRGSQMARFHPPQPPPSLLDASIFLFVSTFYSILIRRRRQVLMPQRPTLLWAIRTNMTAGAAVVVSCSLLCSALTSALPCSVLIFGRSFAHYSGRYTLLAAVLCFAML